MSEPETFTQPSAYRAASAGAAEEHGHAVPLSLLFKIYGTLVVLTAITVAASRIDLGDGNIWVALLIAFIKASLVALYFMHLRWDSLFNATAILAALFFVALFIGLSMLDSHSYQPIIKATPMATLQH